MNTTEYMLNNEQEELVYDRYQCLATVNGHFCKNKVVLKGNCFCSQKHASMERLGTTRREMFIRIYLEVQVDNDVKKLLGLVSASAFAEHRKLASLLPHDIQKYRKALVTDGEENVHVRALKPMYDLSMEYVQTFEHLFELKKTLEVHHGLSVAGRSALSSPLSSRNNSPVASPSVSSNNSARSIDSPYVPRTYAKRSASDPVPGASATKRRMEFDTMDEEDQEQVIREGGVDIIEDEPRSEDESATESDHEFIDADDEAAPTMIDKIKDVFVRRK